MKKFFIYVAAVIGLLIIVAYLLPRNLHLERSIKVDAPVSATYGLVNNLKEWERWSPWYLRDKSMETNYSDVNVGEGAWYKWKSESQGSGIMTITKTIPNDTIGTSLEFEGEGLSGAGFKFKPEADGHTVTWTMDSDLGFNPIARYFGLMLDSWVGKDYEIGLGNLKNLAEGKPVEQIGKE